MTYDTKYYPNQLKTVGSSVKTDQDNNINVDSSVLHLICYVYIT